MTPDTTTIKAHWWMAETPNQQLQGEITYGSTSGAEVDVFGHFYDAFDDTRRIKRFTLNGLTFNATRISLFDCIIPTATMHLPGAGSCRVSSVSGVVGGHYRTLEEILFKEVHVRYMGLREWVWTSGIAVKPEDPPGRLSVSYQVPNSIPLGDFASFSARIEFTGNVRPDFNTLQITEDCSLVLEAQQMQPYLVFLKYITAFQRFLCLAVQQRVYPVEIIGRIDQPKQIVNDQPIFEDYLIIRKASIEGWSRDKLIPDDQLFTVHELNASPAEVFKRFVERQDRLQSSMDLYFSTIYNRTHLPRVEFLTLAQSLEAYHRATMSGKYMDDETYHAGLRQKLWDAIPLPPEIDASFRASLDKKLEYLHEFSLRKRLKELIKKRAVVIEPLIGNAEDFSTMVSESRNRLTHPGDGKTLPDEDYRKLWQLSEKMALLIEVCFLDEIGFAQHRVKEMILKRSQRARRVYRGWV